ncbi:MAG TPA: glycoside hydrolase family 30 beta sandwich domain-containing protein [Terracidiphilus sp.]|nr:glycoside hydrolase family 30 beta sandwich domain-containing protein [Terracidiphilus sp.]
MSRSIVFAACSIALASVATCAACAQSVAHYQTTPDLLEALSRHETMHFQRKSDADAKIPQITVDDAQRFQEIDGFGASLTDAAAWLFAKKLNPAQTEAAFKSLFSRKDGIALSFLRQPLGSSDLAVTFYSFDDLCQQTTKACTTPPGTSDPSLEHFSIAHDQEYILPLLKKALTINPGIHVMLTPWSPPGWMKTTGSMLGSNLETKEESHLRPEFCASFANYLVKSIQGYQAAGVPVWALSVENEPLYAPPTYSGMKMEAAEQATFFGEALAPALAAAGLKTKVMAYDHNWDRPDYPATVLRDPKASALAAGTAWHHYEGGPAVMTKNHEEFPDKGEWVTESSGGTWQKGNVLAEEAGELIASTRNWARSFVLWALATDQNHGPFVGGCDTCRGLVTIDLTDPERPQVKPELDYYVLGHASKFVEPGAVRIASDEPAGAQIKDVAFRNTNGSIVLYALNAGAEAQTVRIECHSRTVAAMIPAGSLATFIWKP